MPHLSARLRANVLLTILSLSIGLVLGEAMLRVVGFSYPSFFVTDDVRGTTHRPGARGWFRNEGQAWVSVNSDGFRDRERALTKPPSSVRIAVLGDSFVEAFGVPLEKTFVSLLEQKAARCTPRTLEVLNFGVSGYGTAQELLTLQQKVWRYDPDIVLLALFVGNDVRNNHRALEPDPITPFFVYKGDRLVLDDSFRSQLAAGPARLAARQARDWLSDRLRLVQLANEVRSLLAARSRVAAEGGIGRIPGSEPGTDNQVFLPPRDPTWQEAWKVTEGLLLAVRDDVRQHGREFWLLVIPSGVQVHPDPQLREAFRQAIGAESLLYPTRRVTDFAERAGIPTVSLVTPFARYTEATHTPLHGVANVSPGFGHLNETGHGLTAEILAMELCEKSAKLRDR